MTKIKNVKNVCVSVREHISRTAPCAAGYEVQKLPVKGHGDWTPVNARPVTGTTFTVPNLVEGSEFEFRVVAINDAGPGKPSKSTGPHKVRDPICKPPSSFASFKTLHSVMLINSFFYA